MSEQCYEWARAEERSLARFVRPDDLPPQFRLPAYINRLDLLQAEGPAGVAAQLYGLIRRQGIQYDLAPFNPRTGVTQLIRKPATILAEQRATCLDLAVLFTTMCLATDLLPILIIVDGHAFAGLSLSRTRHDAKKAPKALAWDRGKLTNLSVLKELAGQEYLLVECTGAAQSQSLAVLYPEGRGRETNGMMSFECACEAGREQVLQHARLAGDSPTQGTREFLYALDIHDLHVNHGFEPKDSAGMSGGPTNVIDARGSQGFLNHPTGPVNQVFGTQRNINTGGGDYAEGNIDKRSGTFNEGDTITVGDITGSTGVAIGRGARATVTTGLGSPDLARLFVDIYRQIEARTADPDVDKEEVVDTVKRIEQEAAKREAASEAKLGRWLQALASMAPDIFAVTVTALTSPGAAVSTVVKKMAEKARQSAKGS